MTPTVNETTVRVRYADTDAMGVAYHGNYFVWFETGRTEYLRALGLRYDDVVALGYHMPVVECSARFLVPARYDDRLAVVTTVTRLDRLRVSFQYRIRNADTGQALTEGATHHAFVSLDGRPKRLPAASALWLCLAGAQP